MSLDPKLIRDSFAHVATHGGDVVEYFYAHLFTHHPDLRAMFPVGMAQQRDRLLKALALVVTNIDNLDTLVPSLRQLGHDHRKFDVRPEHYDAVGASLLATFELFAGEAWTPEVAASWRAAYGLAAQTMIDAAQSVPDTTPPWWEADVVTHERRAWDIAVLNVKPRQPYRFIPGQHVTLETLQWPKQWRQYSIANSPRPDGTLEFHVRQIDSGQVSWALVDAVRVGHVLKLGPAGGTFFLDDISPRSILMIAGGTGLAPLKAMLLHLVNRGETRPVHLFMGARTEAELYDLPAIRALADRHWWLNVTPVVSHDPSYAGYRGFVGDVAAEYAPWLDRDVYVCGPTPMVAAARRRLLETGVQPARIHHERGLDLGSFELTEAGGATVVQQAAPEPVSEPVSEPGAQSRSEPPTTPIPVITQVPLARREPLAERRPPVQPDAPQPVFAGRAIPRPSVALDEFFHAQPPPAGIGYLNGASVPDQRLAEIRAKIEYRRALRGNWRS